MSMAAGQALMMQLATKAMEAAVKGAPTDAFKVVLEKGAAETTPTYAIKVDSGVKKDWQIIEAVSGENPKILNPKYPDPSDPHNKGIFESLDKLKQKCPTANSGDYAFIGDTKWIWDNTLTTPDWKATEEQIPTPITFSSKSEADAYINSNNLKYIYSESNISTVSSFELIQVVKSGSTDSNLNQMADLLKGKCAEKNNECWNGPPQPTGRPPTPVELKTAINEAIAAAA